jgi:hypothetical protein
MRSPVSPHDYQYSEIQPKSVQAINAINNGRSTSPFVNKNVSPNIQAKAQNFVHNQHLNEKKYLLSKP